MRIIINCRSILLSKRTGIGRYTYSLINYLGQIDGSNAYTLYARKKLLDHKRKMPTFHFRNFNTRIDYFKSKLPAGDVYHAPCPDEIGAFDGKVVVTIHDMIYKTFPKAHTPETIDLTQKYMEGIVARADKIICVSENTRKDLHHFFDIDRSKTVTILNGVNHEIFFPLVIMQTALSFLKESGLEPGFVLFVGTIEPRKNLQGLLEALGKLKNSGKSVPKLVVVGMQGWMSQEIQPLIKKIGIEDKVMFKGFITDKQLNMLYNTCGVFVFPSFYEGFGFPIVEAFCAGAAVIASKDSSCPEIAGEAAVLIDPKDTAEIAWAIDRILGDPVFRSNLKDKALKRSKAFSFETTARQTLEAYNGFSI